MMIKSIAEFENKVDQSLENADQTQKGRSSRVQV